MLDIKVETENSETHTRISPDALSDLVHRIGGRKDRFLVVQRVPDRPGFFVQVWHEEGAEYQLEYRAGGPRDHFRAAVGSPDRVAGAMVRWARQDSAWDAGIEWADAELPAADPVPELAPEIREQLEDRIRLSLRGGYGTVDSLTGTAEDYLVKDGVHPVTRAQARELVERLWLERVDEQTRWTDVTDADRLERAFAALEGRGITAREHFTCCRSCGLSEIRAENEQARGFVFFHTQNTDGAASGHGLSLYYGGFDGTEGTTTDVGQEVVAALREEGLTVKWAGSPDNAIEVDALDWRKRLIG
ncbi:MULTISPECIES: DUF6891 domain-containing protein [unclassified Streptomyces]|uniref:DUF6891 domain-containing protein n=1 Tax=unclassified Streptomyces TaxID=2593676 RepID=UPI002DD94BB8|nr:hypothetical protein [Streptomyces sp. NBC_01237]WRZ72040.1 hypothetical protein OG251_10625 [Streptomyces sp. NBC_01237]